MARLIDLVETSRRISATQSRTEKVVALAEQLRRLAPEEIALGVAYLSGETLGGKSGVGPALLRKLDGTPPAPTPTLELREVDRALAEVAATTGAGSSAARLARLSALFAAATPDEQSFLFRLLLGELRQGALEGVMLDGIARASELPESDVRRAAMYAGDLGAVARAALTEGPSGLARFGIQLMRPLLPMLAQPAESIEAAMTALGTAGLEWKIDGARVQVHKAGSEVAVFSRSQHEVTERVPEIVAAVRALPARDLILDGETIALHPNGRPHTFQTTMRRFGRRLDLEAMAQALPLSMYFFDCLRRDDQDLADHPGAERFSALAEVVPAELVIPRLITSDVDAARAFLAGALDRGHEGLMAKDLAARYEAGRRGAGWLKVKRTHTLDLVVLAAEWGTGRRRGFLSNLHLGARVPETGALVMLGKTFKGLTDALLAWQTQALLEREVSRADGVVFVRPELVVEVTFNDVQASPQYPAGLALRFARVERYRPDKTAAEADTIDTVRRIHEASLPEEAA